jgi:MOSC domain-containing protein YiiM
MTARAGAPEPGQFATDGAQGTVVSLNRSHGGVPKLPGDEARIYVDGMEGDRQKNLKYHGGPDRALCLYSAERIGSLRAEGHPIAPGTTGENVTIAGLDWSRLVPGASLRLGADVRIEVTSYADPCRTIRGSFIGGRSGRISQKAHPGWSRVYARVLTPGVIRVGDRVWAWDLGRGTWDVGRSEE